MMSEEVLDQIEQYHRNELTEKARKDLENKISEDQTFAQYVREIKAVMDASRVHQLKQKKELLVKIEKSSQETTPPLIEKTKAESVQRKIPIAWLLAAATAACVILYLTYHISQPKMHPVYVENFRTPSLDLSKSGQLQNESDEILSSAKEEYGFENFKQSAKLFKKAVQNGAHKSNLFYAGISLMQTHRYKKADQLFEELEGAYDKDILSEFRALNYLMLDGADATKSYLDNTYQGKSMPYNIQNIYNAL